MDYIKNFLLWIPVPLWLKVFLASMIPFIESRYAILFFTEFGMPFWQLFMISVLGNMVPVPLIILLFRPILAFIKKISFLEKFAKFLDKVANEKAEKVKKYEGIGLFIFVALPVPGTGAISGAVAAAILNLRISYALPIILLGTIVATSITTGALGIITGIISAF